MKAEPSGFSTRNWALIASWKDRARSRSRGSRKNAHQSQLSATFAVLLSPIRGS
jgi:hypothetical protein